MSNFVKIGRRYINVDAIASVNMVRCDQTKDAWVYYTGAAETRDHLEGAEAEALQNYLDLIACDLNEAETVAAGAKAPTHAALVEVGLLPSREITPEAFSDLLTRSVADGHVLDDYLEGDRT